MTGSVVSLARSDGALWHEPYLERGHEPLGISLVLILGFERPIQHDLIGDFVDRPDTVAGHWDMQGGVALLDPFEAAWQWDADADRNDFAQCLKLT